MLPRLVTGLALAALAGGLAAAGEEAKELSIPLVVTERAGCERVNEPVTFGVPLPDGAVKDLGQLCVLDAAGNKVPVAFRAANKWWHNGSPKWVHVTFNASAPANGKAEYKFLAAKVVPPGPPEQPGFINLEGNRATVDTGVLKFVVNGDKFNLFDGAWVDESGKKQYDDAHMVLAPGHDGGFKMMSSFFGLPKNKLYTAGAAPAKVELLESSWLRCAIKVSGRMTSADDLEGPKDPFGYECYIYAYRGWSAVRLSYVFHNDQAQKIGDYVPLDGIYLDLPTKLAGNLFAAFGKKGGAEKVALREPADRAWLEVESGAKARGGGKLALAEFSPKAEKPRELGWAQLASDKLSVNVGVKWFWNLSPKSLELAGDGRVRVGLWPNVADEVRKVEAGYEKALFSEKEPRRGNWYAGMSKTHELLVGFGSKGAEVPAAERQFAWLADRLRAEAPPSWYCQGSRAWGRLADSTPELFGEAELAAVQRYDKQMRNWLLDVIIKRNDKVFGQWDCNNVFNWGCHVNYVEPKYDADRSKAPQSVIHWDNNYYGFPHTLIIQWARTGDPVFIDFAQAAAAHHADMDTVWAVAGKPSGAARYSAGPMHITIYEDKGGDHNPIYRSDTFNHFKLQEHFELYYLFGDWQQRDVGLQCGKFALALGTSGVDWGQSRSLGNGPLALLAGYQATGEAKYLQAAKAFEDSVIGGYKKGRRVQGGQWWQGGIALEALREFWEQTGYEPARDTLEAMTRDMLAKGVDNSGIHAVAWLAAQKDDAELYKTALSRFARTAGFKDQWGAVMAYGNNQRNTGYAVWYLTKNLPKKDEPVKLEIK